LLPTLWQFNPQWPWDLTGFVEHNHSATICPTLIPQYTAIFTIYMGSANLYFFWFSYPNLKVAFKQLINHILCIYVFEVFIIYTALREEKLRKHSYWTLMIQIQHAYLHARASMLHTWTQSFDNIKMFNLFKYNTWRRVDFP